MKRVDAALEKSEAAERVLDKAFLTRDFASLLVVTDRINISAESKVPQTTRPKAAWCSAFLKANFAAIQLNTIM